MGQLVGYRLMPYTLPHSRLMQTLVLTYHPQIDVTYMTIVEASNGSQWNNNTNSTAVSDAS